MKHQVQQVETLNEYAEYIHTLVRYKEHFSLPQVKVPVSQSSTKDYNRSVKITLVSLKSKDSPKDKVRISKITSCEVLRRKSSTEDKTYVSRTPGDPKEEQPQKLHSSPGDCSVLHTLGFKETVEIS